MEAKAAFRRQLLRGAAVMCVLFPCRPALAAGWLVFVPRVSVSGEYNDNVFFTEEGGEDYITSVTPGVSLRYHRPRLTASLSGATSAQVFARQTNENDVTLTQSGTLTASYSVSPRLTVTADDSVTRVRRTRTALVPLGDQTAPGEQPSPAATEVSTLLPRGGALSNFFATGARYQLAPRWSADVHYSNALGDFNDPGRRDITHVASLGLGYAWSPALSGSVFYSFTRLQFDTVPDTESHSAGVGIGYQFDPTWSVAASVGLFANRPVESGGGSISTRVGPTFDVSLAKQFERSSLSLGGSQQITSSAGVAGASETRAAFLRYRITLLPRLSGSLGASFSDFDTNGANFQALSLDAGLNYSLSRYISVGLSYSYRRRDSDQAVSGVFDAGAVDGNLIQFYLSASYPVWRGSV